MLSILPPLLAVLALQTEQPDPPDVLLILLDDAGPDYFEACRPEIEALGLLHQPASTPNIDSFAAGATRFTRCWGYPLCSPTRAAILTGRHGHRTDVNAVVSRMSRREILSLRAEELCIPEALPLAYSSAMFGKWHLANGYASTDHPRASAGFVHYAGSLGNIGRPERSIDCRPPGLAYTNWPLTINGHQHCESKHHTTRVIDEAVDWIVGRHEPWFAFVALQAIHTPLPEPHEDAGRSHLLFRERANSLLHHADVEIGRLLEAVGHPRDDLYVFLFSDNGSASHSRPEDGTPCLRADRAKGTVYHGGVLVPMFVAGPGIAPGGVRTGLTHVVDVFATVFDLLDLPLPVEAEDSVSMFSKDRQFCFSSLRSPNTAGPWDRWDIAVEHHSGWKLVQYIEGTEELYYRAFDPCEADNLMPPLPGSVEEMAYQVLHAELSRLGL